jgi:methionyl-tRNA formyltransferase
VLRVVFMGSPPFAVPALDALLTRHEVALVVAQPDKPAGRGQHVTRPPVACRADAAGVPVVQPRSARTGELAFALRAARPDLGVVVAYGKILPPDVLAAPRHGCVNIHASILPAYRGAAPIQRALLAGATETGVTIMQLDEGLDTGPTLGCRRIPIEISDTSGTLHDRLAPLGAELLLAAVASIEAGTAIATPQDHARASYAPMLTKADGVIDWTAAAERVRDRIRAVDPWPGAATWAGATRLKLFGALVTRPSGSAPAGEPGRVLVVDGSGMQVACGDGVVTVAEVHPAGKRRMTAAAFAAGRAVSAGLVLGGAGA